MLLMKKIMALVSKTPQAWEVHRPQPATIPSSRSTKAPVKITRPLGRLIHFPDIIKNNSYIDPSSIKGYLKTAFTVAAGSAALNTAAKYALTTSIRSMDITMGGGSAVAGGLVSAYNEARKDYKSACENTLPGNKPLDFKDAVKLIWAQHRAKYGKKFLAGAAGGFAGAWGADLAFDNLDTLKEWGGSCSTWIGERWREWAPPSLQTFTVGLGAWLSEKYVDLREKLTDIKDRVMASFDSQKQLFSLPEERPALPLSPPEPLGPIPESLIQTLEIPPPPVAVEAIEEMVITQDAPTQKNTEIPVTELTPEPEITEIPITDLTPRQQLAAFLDTSLHGTRPDYVVTKALQGTAWAQNEAIDGLYNGRFGFTQNRELAVKLAAEMSEPIKERLAAFGADNLLSSEKELLLKLAFMENNPANAAFGITHSPQDARDIVAKLGQSWYGAPELVPELTEEFAVVNDVDPPIEENFTAEQIAEMPEVMSCTAHQNPDGVLPQFEVACQPADAELNPGAVIGLDVESGGNHTPYKILVTEEALGKSKKKYLGSAFSSLLENMEEPTAPTLTTAR